VPAPVNLSFETGGFQHGGALGWSVTSKASTLFADYGAVRFDATGGPDVDGLIALPWWMTISCPTAGRRVQISPTTIQINFAQNTARARNVGNGWGLCVEPARENLVTTQDFLAWSTTGALAVADGMTDPAGGDQAYDLFDNNAVAEASAFRSIPYTTAAHCISCWTRVAGVPPTNYARIEPGDTTDAIAAIDMPSIDADWVFRSTAGNAVAGAGNLAMIPRRITGADVGSLIVYAPQVELGEYPTSSILTTGTAATRAADVLALPFPQHVAEGGFFTMTMVVAPHFAQDEMNGVDANLLYFDGSNRVLMNDGGVLLLVDGDIAGGHAGLEWERNQVLTITVKHQPGGVEITVSGATVGDGTTSSAAYPAIELPATAYLLGSPAGADHALDLHSLTFDTKPRAYESFDTRWGTDGLLSGFAASLALYASVELVTPSQVENFEQGWLQNESYLRDLATVAQAVYDTGAPENFEDFEEEWLNGTTGYLTSFSPTIALFNAGTEAFEAFVATAGWDNAYVTSFSPTLAAFDGAAPENVEDFEEVRAPVSFTVTPATDTINATGHPYANGERFSIQSLGAVPLGLSKTPLYYVVGATAATLQASLTLGGPAVAIDDHGTGLHTLIADPSLFWTETITI